MNDNWYQQVPKKQISEGLKSSQKWLELVTNFEGLKLKAYPDPASGGKPWTIGYGHTLGVKSGDVITKLKAVELLYKDVERFESAVNRLVIVPLTYYEFDALVSFAFNVGTGNFAKSTMLKLINKKEYALASLEFDRWMFAAGKDCRIKSNNCYGIVRRRTAEKLMFQGKNWENYKEYI